jgi:hypothetical protein
MTQATQAALAFVRLLGELVQITSAKPTTFTVEKIEGVVTRFGCVFG